MQMVIHKKMPMEKLLIQYEITESEGCADGQCNQQAVPVAGQPGMQPGINQATTTRLCQDATYDKHK